MAPSHYDMSAPTEQIIRELSALADTIRASGDVAHVNDRIEISSRGGDNTKKYARMRNGKHRTALGRAGEEKHQAALLSLERRDAIAKISKLIEGVEGLNDFGVVSALATAAVATSSPPLELDQNEYIPPGSVATATITDSASRATKTPAKKKRTKNRPIYSLMQTKQGSRIHAVPGKDPQKRWYEAALCGTKPPGNTYGWEAPAVNDGVSCPGCLKKMAIEWQRYIPEN